MLSWSKRYWMEILVFGAIFGVLLLCNLPGMTWINTNSDGPHYILSAKYMGVAHNTSAPLYLLLGRLFLFIPIGTDAWRMGLISVIATTIAAIIIYLIVIRLLPGNKRARYYGLISAVTYGGSALVISQSTIIETYALATMFMLLAYYWSLKRKWIGVAAVCGLVVWWWRGTFGRRKKLSSCYCGWSCCQYYTLLLIYRLKPMYICCLR